MPLGIEEEGGTSPDVVKEALRGRGLKREDLEIFEVGSKDEEISQVANKGPQNTSA